MKWGQSSQNLKLLPFSVWAVGALGLNKGDRHQLRVPGNQRRTDRKSGLKRFAQATKKWPNILETEYSWTCFATYLMYHLGMLVWSQVAQMKNRSQTLCRHIIRKDHRERRIRRILVKFWKKKFDFCSIYCRGRLKFDASVEVLLSWSHRVFVCMAYQSKLVRNDEQSLIIKMSISWTSLFSHLV